MSELERIERELKIAGYDLEPVDNIESDEDYAQSIGTSVWEICKLFYSQGHSGYSAICATALLTKLLNGQALTPLTNNPEEWQEINGSSNVCYQSKRDFSCFSEDLKTYYDIDEECNKEYELDENGNRTGYCCRKPKDQLVLHELKQFEGAHC